jgi:hypothetical protein
LVLSTNTQTWLGSGQGASQFGAIASSHGSGSQRHPATPLESGTQTVPSGQSPSQVGYGDCSQGTMIGSQRHLSIDPSNTQICVASGQGPSQTGPN